MYFRDDKYSKGWQKAVQSAKESGIPQDEKELGDVQRLGLADGTELVGTVRRCDLVPTQKAENAPYNDEYGNKILYPITVWEVMERDTPEGKGLTVDNDVHSGDRCVVWYSRSLLKAGD